MLGNEWSFGALRAATRRNFRLFQGYELTIESGVPGREATSTLRSGPEFGGRGARVHAIHMTALAAIGSAGAGHSLVGQDRPASSGVLSGNSGDASMPVVTLAFDAPLRAQAVYEVHGLLRVCRVA